MNEPLRLGEDVALFIDWENFKISLAVGHRHPNVSALKEEVSNHGRVVIARAYADWVTRSPELRGASQFINDPPALYAAGIDPVYVPTRLTPVGSTSSEPVRTVRVKNSVDVKMTADCIECAHSYPNIGTYVLVSGDSDFIHVINALRTMGKRVIIIGVSWATSRRLSDQVDELILYDVDVDSVAPAEPAVANGNRGSSRALDSNRPDLAAIIAAIEDIVRNERQAGGTPLLTSIKQRLVRRYPAFDEKAVGFSGFKKLMSRVAQEGNIRLITAGLVDWAIMADEEGPEEANGTPSSGAQGTPVAAAERRSTGGRGMSARRQPKTGAQKEPEVPELTDAPATNGQAAQPAELGEASGEHDVAEATSDLAAILADTLPRLELPEEPDDGQAGRRVADLIAMADTLEHREEFSHVAFNFPVAEVCQALEDGLKAEDAEVTQRWGQAFSRSYVTKLVRGLGNGDLFVKGWHSSADQASGRNKRRRTFYLNREHPLVQKVVQTYWEPKGYAEYVTPPEETPVLEEPLEPAEAPTEPESSFLSRLFRPRW